MLSGWFSSIFKLICVFIAGNEFPLVLSYDFSLSFLEESQRLHPVRTLILLFSLLAATAAAALTAQAQASPPVRVGASVSRSGPFAVAGNSYEKGLRLWQRDANARGGLLGRRIELVLADDASDPELAAQAYSRFLTDEGADVVLGPVHPMLSLAILPVLETHHQPCLFPAASMEILWERSKGLSFGLLAPLPDWPSGFLEIISRTGADKIAVLALDHPDTAKIRERTAQWVKRYGLEPVYTVSATARDIPRVLEEARLAHANVVSIWGAQESALQAVRALREMAWSPKAVYVFSSVFSSMASSGLPKDLDGCFTAVPWDARLAKSFPGGQQFLAGYRGAYGQTPDSSAACAYAAGQVLESAAASAGSIEKRNLRKALIGLDSITILGHFGVDPYGRQLRQIPLTMQWIKGKKEIVWPEDMRTAKAVLGK